MANVNITTILEVSGHGTITIGKHGAQSDSIQVPKVITVTGTLGEKRSSLAASGLATLYDKATESAVIPATFNFLYFWADQDYQIQLITASTEVTHSGAAEVPTILSEGGALGSVGLLASAGTTNNTAVAVLATVDEITIHNISSTTAMNYHLILVD